MERKRARRHTAESGASEAKDGIGAAVDVHTQVGACCAGISEGIDLTGDVAKNSLGGGGDGELRITRAVVEDVAVVTSLDGDGGRVTDPNQKRRTLVGDVSITTTRVHAHRRSEAKVSNNISGTENSAMRPKTSDARVISDVNVATAALLFTKVDADVCGSVTGRVVVVVTDALERVFHAVHLADAVLGVVQARVVVVRPEGIDAVLGGCGGGTRELIIGAGKADGVRDVGDCTSTALLEEGQALRPCFDGITG